MCALKVAIWPLLTLNFDLLTHTFFQKVACVLGLQSGSTYMMKLHLWRFESTEGGFQVLISPVMALTSCDLDLWPLIPRSHQVICISTGVHMPNFIHTHPEVHKILFKQKPDRGTDVQTHARTHAQTIPKHNGSDPSGQRWKWSKGTLCCCCTSV